MKTFRCNTRAVRAALQGVAKSVAKSGALPILSTVFVNVRDGEAIFRTTNLETTATYIIPCENVDTSTMVVDHTQLYATVSAITHETILFEVLETKVVITCPGVTVEISTANPEDFPSHHQITSDELDNLSSRLLLDVFSRAVVTVAPDTTRPSLSGVSVSQDPNKEDTVMVASSDGYRMTVVTFSTTWKPEKVILPAPNVNELLRLAKENESTSIAITERFMYATVPFQSVAGRLIDGKYPNVTTILDRTVEYETATTSTQALLAAIKLCRLYVDKNVPKGTLKLHQAMPGMWFLTLTASNDHGTVVQDIDVQTTVSKNIEIGLNLAFLETALKWVSTDVAVLAIGGDKDPIVVRDVTDQYSYQHVIMPMTR